MLESDPFNQLIGRIYDASLDAAAWPDVVRGIAEIQGATSALMLTSFHAPAQGGFTFPYRIPESAIQLWGEKYIQHDIWAARAVQKELFVEGNVVADHQLLEFDEFLDSVLYKELLSRIDIARLCSGFVFGKGSVGGIPTAMSVFRGVKDAPFGDRELARHRVLIPHLSRSLGIMFRLRDAELRIAASLAALDRVASGVILLGAGRAVVFVNQSARRVLAQADGLRLRQVPTGKSQLAAESTNTQRVLDAALDQCLDPAAIDVPHFSWVIEAPRPSGAPALVLNVSALPARNEFGSGPEQPRAIAFLADPAEPLGIDEAALRQLYGLTPAECQVVAKLCLGQPIGAIALHLEVSENTVKSHLRSIFQRTGTHRQAELVKLVFSLSSGAVR